jgi:hypothetical protein
MGGRGGGGGGKGGGRGRVATRESSSVAEACSGGTSDERNATATNFELSLLDDLALWDAKCRKKKAKKLAAKQREAATRAAALALMQGGKIASPSSPPPLTSSVAVASAAGRKAAAAATHTRPAAAATAAAAATFYSPESVLLASSAASGSWGDTSRLIQRQRWGHDGSLSSLPARRAEEDEVLSFDFSCLGGGGDGTPRSLLSLSPRDSPSSSSVATTTGSGDGLATPLGLSRTGQDAEFDGGAFGDDDDSGDGGDGEGAVETLEELADGFALALDGAWWGGCCLAA